MDQQEFQSQMLEFKNEMLEFKSQMLEFKSQMLEFKLQMLEFKRMTEQRFSHIDGRFTKIDERLENMQGDIYSLKEHARHVDKRMDHIVDSIDILQHQNIELARKTEDTYQSRNTVKIKFGWEWSAVSMAIAFLASGVASGMTKFLWR